MFSALVGKETKTELLDATQALKLRGVDQSHHQLAFIGVGLQTNDVMNWIAIDAFRHCANLNRERRAWRKLVYKIYMIFRIKPYRRRRASQLDLRLAFLDFPIFLYLNYSPCPGPRELTLRILRESPKLACGHGICQKPARRRLFIAARFGILFGAVKKRVFFTGGAASLSSS